MPLRSSLLLLIAASFAAALPTQSESQSQSPRRTLSEATAKVLRERLGGEPFAVLAAWARAERNHEGPSWLPKFGGPDDAAFRELVHTALWSGDKDTAYAGACHIDHLQLDIADIDRWMAAVKPHIFDEDPKYDWDTLRRVMSSDDVAWLMHEPECWFAEIRYTFLVDLHRSMRPEHIPALRKLTHHQDPFLRKGAFDNLGTLSTYTDHHREEIGRAILEWRGPGSDDVVDQYDRSRNPRYQPRAYTLPAAREGWSPLLRATLHRWFLDLERRKDTTAFTAFLMRWAEAERPADEDRLLLNALLGSPKVEGVWIALRAICRLGADAHLRRALEEIPGSVGEELVLAARGDWPALRTLAATDDGALSVALEFDRDGVWLPWVGEAFGDDAEKGLDAIQRLVDASQTLSAPYRPIDDLTARLRQAIDVFGARLDFARLHKLVVAFPAARSQRLLELYWAKITPANVVDSAIEVLEVSPSVDFTGALAGWAKGTDPEPRRIALDLLLRLGDGRMPAELIAHWQQHEAGDPFLLARVAQKEVRDFLAERLRALSWSATADLTAEHFEALAALAMARGLPESVARHWADEMRRNEDTAQANDRAQFPAWREKVLDGEPVEALVAWLSAQPATHIHFHDLGLVDDEAVHDLLRKIRNTPGAHVQWAIGELALAGDFAAKRDMDEMRVRNLYGWLDYASANARTMGRSLDLVPWLIGEIGTNCCRRNGAASALQQLTGFDAWSQPERALVTQHDNAARWWREVGEHLRWSQLAQKFVVAEH